MLQRFRKVSPFLYRSSAPSTEDVIWLNKKIGITRIISLDKETGKKIDLSCKLLGIDHINLYIDMTKSSLIRFLAEIGKLFKDKEKTLIHCHWGRDRTGMAIAMYRCQEQEWSADKAIAEADSLGFGLGLDPEVKALYVSIIQDSDNSADVNDASIVDNQREESYESYYGGSLQNKSWSPYGDRNVNQWPESQLSLNNEEGNPLGGFGPSLVGGGTVL